MDRGIPVSSKILQQKKKERDDEILYNKLKRIQNGNSEYCYRKDVENKKTAASSSKKKNNYIGNLKKLEVHRENQILAKKIKETENRVSQSTSKVNPNATNGFKEPGANPANHKDPRKNEVMKIALENMHLMNRIESMKSVYGVESLNNYNQKRREVLELRCEYPVIIEKPFEPKFNSNASKVSGQTHNKSKLSTFEIYSTKGMSATSKVGFNSSQTHEASTLSKGDSNRVFFGHHYNKNTQPGENKKSKPLTPIQGNSSGLGKNLNAGRHGDTYESSLKEEAEVNEQSYIEGDQDRIIFENVVSFRDKLYESKIVKPKNRPQSVQVFISEKNGKKILEDTLDDIEYTERMEACNFSPNAFIINTLKKYFADNAPKPDKTAQAASPPSEGRKPETKQISSAAPVLQQKNESGHTFDSKKDKSAPKPVSANEPIKPSHNEDLKEDEYDDNFYEEDEDPFEKFERQQQEKKKDTAAPTKDGKAAAKDNKLSSQATGTPVNQANFNDDNDFDKDFEIPKPEPTQKNNTTTNPLDKKQADKKESVQQKTASKHDLPDKSSTMPAKPTPIPEDFEIEEKFLTDSPNEKVSMKEQSKAPKKPVTAPIPFQDSDEEHLGKDAVNKMEATGRSITGFAGFKPSSGAKGAKQPSQNTKLPSKPKEDLEDFDDDLLQDEF